MKENSEEQEKEEKKKKEMEEKQEGDMEEEEWKVSETEEKVSDEDIDFKFHENFSEIKDATPLFKPSDLEQFVSQAEAPKEEKETDKEKKEQVKYSMADYTASRDMEWHEQDLIADIDDLRRVGTIVDRRQRMELRPEIFQDRIRAEMPELPEMREMAQSNEDIVKYADKRREAFKQEFGSFDSMHRKELKKYKREG